MYNELLIIAQGVKENVILIDNFRLLKNNTDALIRRSCLGVNECELYAPCDQNAGCMNTMDSFVCVCNVGFTGNGTVCNDIDECNASNPCVAGSKCVNNIGSYVCNCQAGKVYDHTQNICVDIDECSLNTFTCDAQAKCVNTDGSYTCVCNSGHTGTGKNCTDINECSEPLKVCDEHANCANSLGSFSCTCKSGYRGDGIVNCNDIDECDGNPCQAGQKCINMLGSYVCSQCLIGTNYINGKCVDINECDQNPNCPSSSTCQNTYGSFLCACPQGKFVKNNICIDVLDYQFVFTTNKTYTNDMKDPMSEDFAGELAKIIEEKLKDLLKKNGRENDTVGVVVREISDENGQAKATVDILVNGNSFLPLDTLKASINTGLGPASTLGNLKIFSPEVLDKDECKQMGICPVDQVCNNIVGSYECNCLEVNQVVVNGKCEDFNALEVEMTIVEFLNFDDELSDPNSLLFMATSDACEITDRARA